MKPLELTIYPLREKVGRNAMPGYVVGKRAVSPAEAYYQGKRKRLTDAELAAEYWKAMSGIYDGNGKAARARRATIERFASAPHYDEVTA